MSNRAAYSLLLEWSARHRPRAILEGDEGSMGFVVLQDKLYGVFCITFPMVPIGKRMT